MIETLEYLWDRILKYSIKKDGHLIYLLDISPKGYGRILFNGKKIDVNRASAAINLGLDLDDTKQWACHKEEICRVRCCIDPEHLYVGSAKTNVQDTVRLKTHVEARKTHCSMGHEYSQENTIIRLNGKRVCKICSRNWDRIKHNRKLSRPDNYIWKPKPKYGKKRP